MYIYGFQKTTLLDYPGKLASLIFTGGCDFRCPFCHNFELAEGRLPPVMEEEDLLSFLKSRRGLLDGVAFTGGEPCLHPGLPDLMAKIRDLGFATKLDSNGYHPARLREIIDRGLADYVAMDIKNSPAKYAMTCGIETVDLDVIRESIGLLMERAPDYEFRTTVVAEFHEADDFRAMGEMIRGARRYFLQCFTDRDSVPFGNLHAPTKAQLEEFRDISRNYVPDTELRGVD